MRRTFVLLVLVVLLGLPPGPLAAQSDPEAAVPIGVAGEKCPDALHDAITAVGPDGKQYPTWHPPVHESGCYFGHEHGADPQTSNANASMPPFGYVGAQIGDIEPHEGYKVFVVNRGSQFEDKFALGDTRVVFHMGTSRIGRYGNRFHSVMFDAVRPDGRRVSLQGMADTGGAAGSTCDRPRRGGRDFSTVGCDDPYEIWTVRFQVTHPDDPFDGVDRSRAAIVAAVAAFDPVTTRVPGDDQRVLYTEVYRNGAQALNPTSPEASYRGCSREIYDGPVYFNNAGHSTVYWTDAYGRIAPAGEAAGLLRQEISATPRSSFVAFKYRQDFCDPTVRAPN